MGLAEGIRQEALVAIGSVDGPDATALPDLYVSGSRFGRRVPIRLSAVEQISSFEGVVRVVPRIVGRVTLGAKDIEAILVGLPQEELAEAVDGTKIGRVIDGELHITDLQKMTVESLYELIRRKVRDGMTQRDVAEELGHSRNTVAKALKHPIPPGYRMAKPPQLALF